PDDEADEPHPEIEPEIADGEEPAGKPQASERQGIVNLNATAVGHGDPPAASAGIIRAVLPLVDGNRARDAPENSKRAPVRGPFRRYAAWRSSGGVGRALKQLQVGRRLLAVAALLDVVADLLAFSEAGNAGALERGDVDEGILRAVLGLDEAETLLRIEELDCTFGHELTLPMLWRRRPGRAGRIPRGNMPARGATFTRSGGSQANRHRRSDQLAQDAAK